MPTLARTLHSLRTRGLSATAKSARRRLADVAARLRDRTFDRRYRTETRLMVENAAMRDVTSPNLVRGIRYEPTRAAPFRRVLAAARIPARGTFVDLGCGKGRVLMLAALHGFERVTGVDYSPALCEAARRNLDALRTARGLRFDAAIHLLDAADYAFQPDDAVVFLYNPFDDVVLGRVLDALRTSLAAHPRPLWLVYHNPVWRGAVAASGLFADATTYTFGGCRFDVFRSDG
jgi:SAM-dependent methyltransferase